MSTIKNIYSNQETNLPETNRLFCVNLFGTLRKVKIRSFERLKGHLALGLVIGAIRYNKNNNNAQ
jgi:hypothetical protein